MDCGWDGGSTAQTACLGEPSKLTCCTAANTSVFGCGTRQLAACLAQSVWSAWSGWQQSDVEPQRKRSRYLQCGECLAQDRQYTSLEPPYSTALKFCGYNRLRQQTPNCGIESSTI